MTFDHYQHAELKLRAAKHLFDTNADLLKVNTLTAMANTHATLAAVNRPDATRPPVWGEAVSSIGDDHVEISLVDEDGNEIEPMVLSRASAQVLGDMLLDAADPGRGEPSVLEAHLSKAYTRIRLLEDAINKASEVAGGGIEF